MVNSSAETRNALRKQIFRIKTVSGFNELCMAVFHWQSVQNPVYAHWLHALGINTSEIKDISEIPFLPIGFFKNQEIYCGSAAPQLRFTSSGTTGSSVSTHLVAEAALYEESIFKGFELIYGKPEDQVIIGLLPSYLERPGSSLIYMCEKLIERSGQPESGFYLNNYQDLSRVLNQLREQNKRVWLIGVSFALLDLAELAPPVWEKLVVVETGGMKGRRKEMIREELHQTILAQWPLKNVHSEYGMAELLSQAWMGDDGSFRCPPWMKVQIHDPGDPFQKLNDGKTGSIQTIDLANLDSCSFIATQDLGKLNEDGSFEVLGRFDNSDVRGCNLLV